LRLFDIQGRFRLSRDCLRRGYSPQAIQMEVYNEYKVQEDPPAAIPHDHVGLTRILAQF